MERSDNGILVAVEGIDGAGKTTQVARLVEFLERAGEEVVRSREPTDGPWGRKIRQSAAQGRLGPKEELLAFVEDRKQHVREVILPALVAGKIVVLDRYFYSTIAYQGVGEGGLAKLTAEMQAIAPEPDVVFLVDVPPEVGLARISGGRGEKPNAFENLENLTNVRRRFLELPARHRNVSLIDGSQGIAAVSAGILQVLLDGALKARRCAKPSGCDGVLCDYAVAGQCRWARMRELSHSASPPEVDRNK